MKESVFLQILETPLGEMTACTTNKGICLLEFSDNETLSKELDQIKKNFNSEIVMANHPHFSQLKKELKDYFDGNIKVFTIPLTLVGTPFQKSVWKELLKIPYGTTKSYQEQSNNLGNAKAIRAVATANGANKISILVPCHRVIGSNGKLTGYAGGIWRKQKLLELENAILF